MNRELARIIEEALEPPNPECPDCEIEGVIKGWGEIAWCECPKCGKKIGRTEVM